MLLAMSKMPGDKAEGDPAGHITEAAFVRKLTQLSSISTVHIV